MTKFTTSFARGIVEVRCIPGTSMAARIFISYSKQDPQPTEDLAAALAEAGYEVWWDTGLKSGQAFREVINREIERADAVVVIWTENSIYSDWVLSEADLAYHSRKLITVRVEDLSPLRIPMPYTVLHTDIVEDHDAVLDAIADFLADEDEDGDDGDDGEYSEDSDQSSDDGEQQSHDEDEQSDDEDYQDEADEYGDEGVNDREETIELRRGQEARRGIRYGAEIGSVSFNDDSNADNVLVSFAGEEHSLRQGDTLLIAPNCNVTIRFSEDGYNAYRNVTITLVHFGQPIRSK